MLRTICMFLPSGFVELHVNEMTQAPIKSAGNPSPVWEKGRDEGLPSKGKAAAVPSRTLEKRRSLTPASVPSGRGVPRACLFRRRPLENFGSDLWP